MATANVDTEEVWKDIPDWEGCYQASTFGRIRSLTRYTPPVKHSYGKTIQGGIRSFSIMRGGYPGLSLCKNSVKQTYTIHYLVALTFLGPRPEGYTVNHIDGNKRNSRPSNLEYLTLSDNHKHAFRLGLRTSFRRDKRCVLSDQQVHDIRLLFFIGKRDCDVARLYNICSQTARLLRLNKIYRWVS